MLVIISFESNTRNKRSFIYRINENINGSFVLVGSEEKGNREKKKKKISNLVCMKNKSGKL